MDARVWAESGDVMSQMLPFAVGQTVTWPIASGFNERVLAEHVGAETAAQISMGVSYEPLRPEDRVYCKGTVSHIEVYRCRLSRGQVIPGSIETFPVLEVDGWESDKDGAWVSGYLVTLTNMRESEEFPTEVPCEDCGGLVVSGLEPFSPGDDDPVLESAGVTLARSEWCTNLACPSNHVLSGLTRVGVNDYICTVCGQSLRTPMSAVRAHRATH